MLAGRRRTGRPPRWAAANDGERSCATPPWGREKQGPREVPYGDHRDRAPFKRPKDRRPAGRAEVITDVVSDGGTHTVGLQTVVDLGVAGDRNVCILREDGADLKDAACPPLTELAVTGHDCERLLLNGDSDSPTGTLSSFVSQPRGLHRPGLTTIRVPIHGVEGGPRKTSRPTAGRVPALRRSPEEGDPCVGVTQHAAFGFSDGTSASSCRE